MVKGKKVLSKPAKQIESERKRQRNQEVQRLHELDSSSSIESYLSIEEASEEDENLIDIFDILYNTDNESVQEEEPEYTKQKVLEEETDFFEVFGHIPDVEDLSEDISVVSMPITKVESVTDPSKDVGRFVDPLTGGDIRSKESSLTAFETNLEGYQDEIEEEEKDKEMSEESELSLPEDLFIADEETQKIEEAEDTFENFLELEIQKDYISADDIDWEAVAKQEEAKHVQQNTLEFICELINRVVGICEYVSPEIVLRQNLDKRKVLKELLAKRDLYGIENNVRQFLNRKVVEHFRRKKSFRAIMQDNPKTLAQDKIKFIDAAQRLDLLLEKESQLNSSSSKLVKDLQNRYGNTKKEAENQIQLLENNIKNNLVRDYRPKANVLIEQLLSKMNRYRKEINDVRFTMLNKQHIQARLTESLAKLEDLGNGLSMRDFGTLQAETQTLGKKIEERNAELNRLYIRCHSDIHTMAHYKEKQKMLRNTIDVQQTILESLMEEKDLLRKHLHNLKLNHISVRRQLKDLSFQGGLLDKPALMFDYDATVERLCQQHEKVNNLKSSLIRIQYKIDKIVKRCPTA